VYSAAAAGPFSKSRRGARTLLHFQGQFDTSSSSFDGEPFGTTTAADSRSPEAPLLYPVSQSCATAIAATQSSARPAAAASADISVVLDAGELSPRGRFEFDASFGVEGFADAVEEKDDIVDAATDMLLSQGRRIRRADVLPGARAAVEDCIPVDSSDDSSDEDVGAPYERPPVDPLVPPAVVFPVVNPTQSSVLPRLLQAFQLHFLRPIMESFTKALSQFQYGIYLYNLLHTILPYMLLCWFSHGTNSFNALEKILLLLQVILVALWGQLAKDCIPVSVERLVANHKKLAAFCKILPHVACPGCNTIYKYSDCNLVDVTGRPQSLVCMHVEYPNHIQGHLRQPCRIPLLGRRTIHATGGQETSILAAFPENLFHYAGASHILN